MTLDDHIYYAMRERQEVQAVSKATCAAARERHQELADAYRFRCSLILSRRSDSASSATVVDHPAKRRQPIISSRTKVLAASPAAAPTPFFRA